MLIAHVLREKGGLVHTISQDATLEEAARALNEKGVGALVILDGGETPLGVLSERDIIRAVAKLGAASLDKRVGDVMSRGVITMEPMDTVDDGLSRMTEKRVRHLPVVGDEGRLIGIVSIGDLVKMRIQEVELEAASMQAYIATG
ncbi:MAG: CBS domain-containing protein [Hydrogenophilaceae bacterium]|jgi:CBS domain-containing protein|nr:CBS domain-containing protein [Hydrogenophilaceae bacterium]